MSTFDSTPLDRLDPKEAWQPWQPTSAEPWNRVRAGHLYRRAGFGASAGELLAAEKQGFAATLARLLEGAPGARERDRFLESQGRSVARRDSAGNLRAWWLYTMLHTLDPLGEKLVLFWHNHFATSIDKVGRATLLFAQNCLFRAHARSKFGPFLLAISKDAAMLEWLDSNSNIKAHPNENYAREIMELFSLGVGNYAEKDVREAARAFTGWHTNDGDFDFEESLHDDGPKTILGHTGSWNGADVVGILARQPACARFLVRKFYRFFVSETRDPTDQLLEPLVSLFRASDGDIHVVVRAMLSSRLFFSGHAFRQRVKSPVEFVLGAVRATTDRAVPQRALLKPLDDMGQTLFAPPNVKGWPGATAWLNSANLLARDNFAQMLASAALWDETLFPKEPEAGDVVQAVGVASDAAESAEDPPPSVPNHLDPAERIRSAKLDGPEAIVGFLLDVYLPGGIREVARRKLVAFMGEGKPAGRDLDRRIRETVHAILSLPEYQLA
jgi:hypothetical protein